jgi:hypothetical protein
MSIFSTRRDVALLAAWLLLFGLGVALASRFSIALSVAPLALLPLSVGRRLGHTHDALSPLWVTSAVFLFTYLAVPVAELWRVAPFDALPGFVRLSPPHTLMALGLGGVGYVAFLAGFEMRAGARLASSLERPLPSTSRRKLIFLAVGLTLVGLLSLELVLLLADAGSHSFGDMRGGSLRQPTLEVFPSRGYLKIGLVSLQVGLALSLWLYVDHQLGRDGGARRIVLCVLGVVVFAVLVFGVLLGSRELALITVAQAIAIAHLKWRAIRVREAVALAVVLAVLGSAYVSFREGEDLSSPWTVPGNAARTFDGANNLATALARVRDYRWGQTLVEDAFITYIPRVLVPSKPDVYGIVRAEHDVFGEVGQENATFPPGLLGEGFVNFGLLGIPLFAMSLGLLLRAAHAWAVAARSAPAVLIFGAFIGSQAGVMRGLGHVLPDLLIVVALLALAYVRVPRIRARQGIVAACALVALLGTVAAVTVDPVVPSAQERSGTNRLAGKAPLVPPSSRGDAGRDVQAYFFWASWCAKCRDQLRELAHVRGADISTIAYQDLRTQAEPLIRQIEPAWPLALRDSPDILARWEVGELPTTIVVDRRNRVKCAYMGPDQAKLLEQSVQLSRRGERRCA